MGEVEEAEQYRKLSVQEAAYRKLSQQYEEQLNYGMDSMSLDSGEDSKADDMDEMAMPNPGSIQHFERLFYPSNPCKSCSKCQIVFLAFIIVIIFYKCDFKLFCVRCNKNLMDMMTQLKKCYCSSNT